MIHNEFTPAGQRHIDERLRQDPQYYVRATQPIMPAALRRHPQLRPALPFRRFIARYNNQTLSGPKSYHACGVQFPDGQVITWSSLGGHIAVHRNVAALREHCLRFGNFSIQFLRDSE